MKLRTRAKRRAISPILAEVALIAITLVAATALSGFFFGEMSGYTKSATVMAEVSVCSVSASSCVVTLSNSGTANGYVEGCTLHNAGIQSAAVVSPTGFVEVTAGGGTAQVTCSLTSSVSAVVGSQAVGSIQLDDGFTVPFAATWSA